MIVGRRKKTIVEESYQYHRLAVPLSHIFEQKERETHQSEVDNIVVETSLLLINKEEKTKNNQTNDERTHTESDIAVSDHADQSPETHTSTANHESSPQPTPTQPFRKKDPLNDAAFQTSNDVHPRMRQRNLLLLVVITSFVEYLLRCN